MKNYIIVNEFLTLNSFNKIYSRLKNAFSLRGQSCELLTNVSAIDLLKTNGNNMPILFFDKDILLAKNLEKCGYRCVNSSFVIETCDDKAKTYLALLNKVAMPKTFIAPFSYNTVGYTNLNFIDSIESQLNYPIVVKQTQGSFGEQVYLAQDRKQLIDIITNIGHSKIIFQEFIQSSFGKDVRVYVVGDRVVASALRTNQNDFRSNVASGGKMLSFNLSKEYEKVALEACRIIGADFAGVDLLISDKGPILCEVNSNAHFSAISDLTGVDVALSIVDHFLSLKNN